MAAKLTIDWDPNKRVFFVRVGSGNDRVQNSSVQGLQSDLKKKGVVNVTYKFTGAAKREINNPKPKFI